MKATLYDYQRYCAEFIKQVPRCGLFLDVGLGKTLITLTAFVELAQDNKLHGHILVIAPKRIAVNTWPDEITKWDHTKHGTYKLLADLSKKKREKILDSVESDPPTIYIINRELIPKLIDRFPGDKWPFLNVVIDEAQSFKGYDTQGFKALKSIAPFTHRWIELTGTPSPNGLMDIWSLIYLIDGGRRLGENITQYRSRHFVPGRRTPEGYPYEWLLIDGHDQYIHHAIKDVAISMMKKDYLDLPPVTHNLIELDMTKNEREIYNQLKKDKVLPLLDGDAIEAANAAVLSGALLQLSNGAIYADEEKKEIIELHDHKIKALEEIIEGSNGQPILCFYWYKHDKIRLLNHFPKAELFTGDPEQLRRWNNKEIPLLFAQPASAGHGLNFQYGGHILVFFVVPTSLELWLQSVGRLDRNGQTEPVIVHYLKMRGTVEDRVIMSLLDKQETQQALIDAVRAEIGDMHPVDIN
ncbi:SNF2 family DNA or RNA helicase [Rossellomorea marisflavi]